MPTRILVVEDDRPLARLIERVIRGNGWETEVVANSFTAKRALASRRHGLLLVDLDMCRGQGWQLIDLVRRDYPNMPVVALSNAPEVLPSSQMTLLDKPFALAALSRLVGERVQAATSQEPKVDSRKRAAVVQSTRRSPHGRQWKGTEHVAVRC